MAGGRVSSRLQNIQPISGALQRDNGGYFPIGKAARPRRESDRLPPSTAEVRNEWCQTSTPPKCLHGVDKEICTLFTFRSECIMDNPPEYAELTADTYEHTFAFYE